MDEDEDLREKELNYKRICRNIIRTLNKIKANFWFLDKVKLPNYQKENLIEIKGRLEKINYSEYNAQIFAQLMDISCNIEDLLNEIGTYFKTIIKKIDNPLENDKKEIYLYFKIEKPTPELKKVSNEFNSNLSKLSALIQKIMDKYLSYYKED